MNDKDDSFTRLRHSLYNIGHNVVYFYPLKSNNNKILLYS